MRSRSVRFGLGFGVMQCGWRCIKGSRTGGADAEKNNCRTNGPDANQIHSTKTSLPKFILRSCLIAPHFVHPAFAAPGLQCPKSPPVAGIHTALNIRRLGQFQR
jgi:hypothetical protein